MDSGCWGAESKNNRAPAVCRGHQHPHSVDIMKQWREATSPRLFHWKGGLEGPSSCFNYHRESKRAFLQHQGGWISTCMKKWTKGQCVWNGTGMMKQFVSNATKLDFELIVIPVSTLPSLHTATVECDTVWNPTESAASALLCHQHGVPGYVYWV